jgi:hypothetical protein
MGEEGREGREGRSQCLVSVFSVSVLGLSSFFSGSIKKVCVACTENIKIETKENLLLSEPGVYGTLTRNHLT